MTSNPQPDHEVVVVGAGLAGIGTGIELARSGCEDFVILEESDGVGGTWKFHTYPGLTCDIPALTYSFSYEQNPDWSSLWAPQDELLAYCEHCVEKYELRPRVRFGCRVLEATWDEERNVWVIATTSGPIVARYLVNCSGYLNTPKVPDVPGLESFAGATLHSSGWREDLDLSGKRVGLIGTGATAIQLAPFIAAQARSLTVFQRTPIWLLPKPALKIPRALRRLFRSVPSAQRAARLLIAAFQDLVFFRVFTDYAQTRWLARLAERTGRWQIRRQVVDRDVQARLTPAYSWGCKRPSFTNAFYPIFNRDNVELVTDPIVAGDSAGLTTGDGVSRPFDVLVYATGYQPFERGALPTYPVRGRTEDTLDEYWQANRYQAYRGLAVHGFPNFFLVFGPYSIVSTSYIATVEIAARTIASCLSAAREQAADCIEVEPDAQAADHADMLERKQTSIWAVGDCATSNTYYVDRFGDTPGFRPTYHYQEWRKSKRPGHPGFSIRKRRAGSPAVAGSVGV